MNLQDVMLNELPYSCRHILNSARQCNLLTYRTVPSIEAGCDMHFQHNVPFFVVDIGNIEFVT